MKTIGKTLAYGLLSALPITALATTSQTTPMPAHAKTITVYNTSNQTVYPVIQAPSKQDGKNVLLDLYVNAKKNSEGIPSGGSAKVTLPNANWWQSGRVYIFTRVPPKPKVSPTNDGPDKIYVDTSNVSFGLDDNYQLVEYTFTNKLTDYDISYVDGAYLPIAVEVQEPKNGLYGYTGLNAKIGPFQEKIQNFTSNAGWPHEDLPGNSGYQKIPGGYNLFALDQDLSTHGTGQPMLTGGRVMPTAGNKLGNTDMAHQIVQRWVKWNTDPTMCKSVSADKNKAAFCHAFQKTVQTEWQTFEADASHYNVKNPSNFSIVEHIIGYLTYGNLKQGQSDPILNQAAHDRAVALEEGIPYTTSPTLKTEYQQHKYPDIHSQYALNPYVTLIHKIIGSDVYAFSIDDGVGNIQIGLNPSYPNHYQGIIIQVAGTNKLPNNNRYVQPSHYAFHLNLGPGWSKAVVCGKTFGKLDDKYHSGKGSSEDMIFKQDDATCHISLSKDNKTLLSFDAVRASTQSEGGYHNSVSVENCVGSQCDQVNVDNQSTVPNYSVDVPSPKVQPSGGSAHVNLAPGWTSITINGKTTKEDPSKGYSYPISKTSTIQLTDNSQSGSDTLSFTAAFKDGKWSISNCEGNVCANVQAQNSKQDYIIVPAPQASHHHHTSGGTAHVNLAPGWSSININGKTTDINNPSTGHSYPVNAGDSIILQGQGDQVSFTAQNTNGTWSDANCTGDVCTQINTSGDNIDLPPPKKHS